MRREKIKIKQWNILGSCLGSVDGICIAAQVLGTLVYVQIKPERSEYLSDQGEKKEKERNRI